MSLFQRMRTPFGEAAEADPGQPQRRAHAVGELLRERRRELELDLDSIGEALRIKPIYLAAIEQGRTEDLPGPTYAIGFVRAYAHYLGFDSERVLDSYKAESAEVYARPDLSLPVPLGARSLPGGPILLVGLILALCGYGTWYYLATGDRARPERVAAVPLELQRQASPDIAAGPGGPAVPKFGSGLPSAQPSAPPASDPGASPTSPSVPVPPGPAASAKPAAAAAPPTPAAVPAVAGSPAPIGVAMASSAAAPPATAAAAADGTTAPVASGAGSIDIRALADCWIQIRAADQTIVFSRVLKAGETYHVPRSGLFLRTGNAGALAVLVDGKQAPSIGVVGTLRRNVALEPDALLAGTAVRG